MDISVGEEAIGNADNRIRNLCNINRGRHELDFAALNSADIQHIIDKGQQVLGAVADLIQTGFDLGLGIELQRNVGKADDGIHGCPNVVGHIVQEGAFRGVG